MAMAAQLKQEGHGLTPRHNLREWRLELDSGGFVQLILSSSGFYMLRHGYHYPDESGSDPVTLMLSESNIGRFAFHGTKLLLSTPIKSSCRQRLGGSTELEMEVAVNTVRLDDYASRNFVVGEYVARRELPFFQQMMGSLDGSSPIPVTERDPDGSFESRVGCIQNQASGAISFIPN